MIRPAKRFSSGLGSKLSMWLVPPTMNSQMTLFALGVKWGRPSGGAQRSGALARATPSRCSMAPNARPVKPMPMSARKERRLMPGLCHMISPSLGLGVAHFFQLFQFQNMALVFFSGSRFLGIDQTIQGKYLDGYAKDLPRFRLCQCLFVKPDSTYFPQEVHVAQIGNQGEIQARLNGRDI